MDRYEALGPSFPNRFNTGHTRAVFNTCQAAHEYALAFAIERQLAVGGDAKGITEKEMTNLHNGDCYGTGWEIRVRDPPGPASKGGRIVGREFVWGESGDMHLFK